MTDIEKTLKDIIDQRTFDNKTLDSLRSVISKQILVYNDDADPATLFLARELLYLLCEVCLCSENLQMNFDFVDEVLSDRVRFRQLLLQNEDRVKCKTQIVFFLREVSHKEFSFEMQNAIDLAKAALAAAYNISEEQIELDRFNEMIEHSKKIDVPIFQGMQTIESDESSGVIAAMINEHGIREEFALVAPYNGKTLDIVVAEMLDEAVDMANNNDNVEFYYVNEGHKYGAFDCVTVLCDVVIDKYTNDARYTRSLHVCFAEPIHQEVFRVTFSIGPCEMDETRFGVIDPEDNILAYLMRMAETVIAKLDYIRS